MGDAEKRPGLAREYVFDVDSGRDGGKDSLIDDEEEEPPPPPPPL